MIIKGGQEMYTHIVEKDAFKVLGMKIKYNGSEEAMAQIPAF